MGVYQNNVMEKNLSINNFFSPSLLLRRFFSRWAQHVWLYLRGVLNPGPRHLYVSFIISRHSHQGVLPWRQWVWQKEGHLDMFIGSRVTLWENRLGNVLDCSITRRLYGENGVLCRPELHWKLILQFISISMKSSDLQKQIIMFLIVHSN